MGISISVTADVGIIGGSSKMEALLRKVADRLKAEQPALYQDAFLSLDWGEVYLTRLDAKDFRLVHDLILSVDPPLLKSLLESDDPFVAQIWREVLDKIEADPRMNTSGGGAS